MGTCGSEAKVVLCSREFMHEAPKVMDPHAGPCDERQTSLGFGIFSSAIATRGSTYSDT